MRRAKITAALLAVLVLVILSFQNPAPVEFKFLWMEIQIPKIMLMVLSAAVGAVVTLVIQYLLRSGRVAPAIRDASGPSSL